MSPKRKVCTLEELLSVRRAAAAAGRTVVHCHGCFDIVHPGHVQYLQFARGQGDVLVVSLTADPQVNKGAARPLIPEDLRAANLAALECVDYVYVNPDPTAVELLDALRPDLYVKGREYEANHDPRFLAERDTVTRHGGRVVFSSGEIVFSSTALIGGSGGLEVFNDEKIRRFRQQHGLTGPSLHHALSAMRGLRFVVVGDYLLDRYHQCDASGIAGEAPVMNLRLLRSDDHDGGASTLAQHLAALGAEPTLITGLSDDAQSSEIRSRLASRGVDVDAVVNRRQVATQHRYLVDQSKMMKVDEGATAPLDSRTVDLVIDQVLAAADGAAGVIFGDYGFGMITGLLLERIMPLLRPRVPLIAAGVSGPQASLLRFRDVDLLCPSERDVRQQLNDTQSGLNAVMYRLFRGSGARQALVTMDKQGLVAFDQCQVTQPGEAWERKLRGAYLPSLGGSAVDSLGCAEALLATASATLAVGASLHAAAYLGSLAAALAGQQLGNQPVQLDAMVARLNQTLHPTYTTATRLAS